MIVNKMKLKLKLKLLPNPIKKFKRTRKLQQFKVRPISNNLRQKSLRHTSYVLKDAFPACTLPPWPPLPIAMLFDSRTHAGEIIHEFMGGDSIRNSSKKRSLKTFV